MCSYETGRLIGLLELPRAHAMVCVSCVPLDRRGARGLRLPAHIVNPPPATPGGADSGGGGGEASVQAWLRATGYLVPRAGTAGPARAWQCSRCEAEFTDCGLAAAALPTNGVAGSVGAVEAACVEMVTRLLTEEPPPPVDEIERRRDAVAMLVGRLHWVNAPRTGWLPQ